MALKLWIAVGVSAWLAGCSGDDDSVEPDNWDSCTGAQGRTLTCESLGARPLLAAKFDAARGCFEAFAAPSGVCAVPTYCPGGVGTTFCAVTSSGDVYLAYALYGEELTQPWHVSEGTLAPAPLTSSEQPLCTSVLDAYKGLVDADGGVGDEQALGAKSTTLRATPACN